MPSVPSRAVGAHMGECRARFRTVLNSHRLVDGGGAARCPLLIQGGNRLVDFRRANRAIRAVVRWGRETMPHSHVRPSLKGQAEALTQKADPVERSERIVSIDNIAR